MWTRRFQRVVPHRGWDALRPVDGGGRVQPIRAVLSDCGADRRRACGRGSSGRFATYGLPRALRTDNGSPFASTGRAGLSRLAVWWLKLGIQLDRIDPGTRSRTAATSGFI